ncbi:Bromodomain-containing protein [Thalictrum thalictroides]|uniref:Bromodomain-containing protein n=1 Tax=Thalictrum thalictroides TaxID=46969 RepID=A0A7J6WQH7_THATH|nr:Bromodomain-containing protein [Thalictrum thalictroides]
MKRKRGYKKGKKKQSNVANVGKVNVKEDNEVLEEEQDVDNAELDSEIPTAIESGEPPKLIIEPQLVDKPSGQGQGRVKVKLKSSKKIIEPLSDAQTHSDTDKSSSHISLEKQGEVVDKLNDAYFLPKLQPVSVYTSKKAGGIRIKSSTSRGVSLVSTPINHVTSPLQGQGECSSQFASDIKKSSGSSMSNEALQKERKFSHHNPRYNEEELNTSLGVIRKIMKMDAAEPFNAPVDPVALGIPDYFDIIETPMDFGTICNNLEGGNSYRNSEDKNFMKYWTAAGLCTNQSNRVKDAAFVQDTSRELPLEDVHEKGNILEAGGRMKDTIKSKPENVLSPSLNASEGLQVGTMVPSSQEIMHSKGTHSKQKKRGRHGFNKHKSNCLCAVCVVRRRRKEREEIADVVEAQIDISDGNMSQEFKQEETSLENRCSEDVSSNLGRSPYPDADVVMEEQGQQTNLKRIEKQSSPRQEMNGPEEVEIQKRGEDNHSDQAQLGDGSGEELNPQSRSEEMDDSLIMAQKHNSKDDNSPQHKEEAVEMRNLQQKHELQMMQQQTLLCNNLLLDKNPLIGKLCGALFPSHRKSVWSGPHSFGHRDSPVRERSAIHAAVEMFIK